MNSATIRQASEWILAAMGVVSIGCLVAMLVMLIRSRRGPHAR